MKYLENVGGTTSSSSQTQYPKSFPITLDRDAQLAGSFAGIILHESGHALFDILDVPIFGREEDAADEIAAFVALQFQRQVAETVVAALAASLDLTGDNPTTRRTPRIRITRNCPPTRIRRNTARRSMSRCALDPMCAWSDEHGSGSQRFYKPPVSSTAAIRSATRTG